MTTTTDEEITTTDHAEQALQRLGEIEREKKRISTRRDDRISEQREEARTELDPINAEKRRLELNLKKYGKKQQRKWGRDGRRSLKLTHGQIGFRRVTSIAGKPKAKDEGGVIDQLKDLDMPECVRVHESIDYNELGNHEDSVLEQLGLRRKVEDKFFAEPAMQAEVEAVRS